MVKGDRGGSVWEGARMADEAEQRKEMIRAVKAGKLARVKELLAANPELVAVREEDGSTPLNCAAWKGHAEIAALLIDRGADIHAQSRGGHYGGTPLHQAAHANNRAVAELLIQRGADVHLKSLNGRTPLEETAAHNATAVAKLLRANGAAE